MFIRITSRRAARRTRLLSTLSLSVLALGAGCASVDHPSPTTDSIVSSAAERATTLELLERALELADVAPLAVERPPAPRELDPRDDAFWRACAFAFDPEVRAARRKFLEARALESSAGAPGKIAVELDDKRLLRDDREIELGATFDLLGILGVGPYRAARELAGVETRLALADLERAVWKSRFDVDRARVRLTAARARVAALESLAADAANDDRKIEILDSKGWLAPSASSWAKSAEHAIELRATEARVDAASARRSLAIAAGLPDDSPALDASNVQWIDSVAARELGDAPDARQLLDNLPDLRAMRLWCALAEARLRATAAERWPDLRLGPKTIFTSDAIFGGFTGALELPWPGSIDGRIRAALEECERMREAVEDTLLASLAAVRETRDRLREERAAIERDARPIDAASLSMWRTARARFAIDSGALEGWALALEQRIDPMLGAIDRVERAAQAELDAEEASGPAREGSEVQP